MSSDEKQTSASKAKAADDSKDAAFRQAFYIMIVLGTLGFLGLQFSRNNQKSNQMVQFFQRFPLNRIRDAEVWTTDRKNPRVLVTVKKYQRLKALISAFEDADSAMLAPRVNSKSYLLMLHENTGRKWRLKCNFRKDDPFLYLTLQEKRGTWIRTLGRIRSRKAAVWLRGVLENVTKKPGRKMKGKSVKKK